MPSPPFLLLPLLLVLSLPFTTTAQEPPLVDQAEYFGWRMGQNPFCDSFCMPNGKWELRRDWVLGDLDNFGKESTFIWAVDGDPQYWSERCGTRVNDMIFGNRDPNTFILQSCFPGIIYMMEYVVEFENDEGLLTETLILNGAFTPTQEAWDEFVDLVGERISPNFVDSEIYTLPWSLFRIMPSLEGASYTNTYNGDVYTKKTWITTYERNCCTFVGSVLPIQSIEFCDYDEDISSDQEEFVSYLFCEYFFDNAVVDDYYVGCGGPTDGDDICDRVYVGVNGGESREEKRDGLLPREPRKRMSEVIGILREEVLKRNEGEEEEDIVEKGARRAVGPELMATVRQGGKVEARRAPGGRKQPSWFDMDKRRGTYDYSYQPIPPIGEDYNYDVGPFYYVPYTSSIVAPYCAYKRDTDDD